MENKTSRGQVNFFIPVKWKETLKRIARIEAQKQDKDISYLDLIKAAIQDKYGLKNE